VAIAWGVVTFVSMVLTLFKNGMGDPIGAI
jgi:hypothetical protein